jgi:hypothetical protein
MDKVEVTLAHLMQDFRSFFLGNRYIVSLWEKSRPTYRRFFPYANMNSLDKKIERCLPANGIFIEAAANDGLNQSDTLFFALVHGWKGGLVEPVPRLFERGVKNRPDSFCVNATLVAPEDSGAMIDLIYVD